MGAQRKRWLQVAEAELAGMRARDPRGERLALSGHVQRRLFERAVPERTVRQIVLRAGAVVSRRPDGCAVLLGETENGRPLQVVVAYGEGYSHWRVVTALRPDTRPWQWADGYRRRVCRCAPAGYED